MLKPFFREFDGWWHAQVRVGTKRKQVKLVKGRENERRAYELFNELKAKEPEEVQWLTVGTMTRRWVGRSPRPIEALKVAPLLVMVAAWGTSILTRKLAS